MYKECVICGKEFECFPSKQSRKCCSKKCAGVYRKNTYGCLISNETRQKNAETLRNRWKDKEFRNKVVSRMINDNPVYKEGVVEKANETKRKRGKLPNNFKYGNGKMSVYEQIAWETLREFGFLYNKSISVNSLRKKYPEKHYSTNYKPDFVNIEKSVCVEIDGQNHQSTYQRLLDKKKDECLSELGYKVVRFTHADIDSGKLWRWIKEWQN